jgi:LacI family transcriptional regulator
MKKGQVTIRDIAIKLNVSVSTVSRALRGQPEVNQETRNAVMEMAKKLNYEPNMIAKGLRNNKTYTLGVIVPDLATHFFASNISGMQDVASQMGYNIMICQSNENYESEVANINALVSARVDGILISLSRETNSFEHLTNLIDREIPLVFFDRVAQEIETPKVIVDDHDGAFKAVEHLILTGCKRIAHISGPENLAISINRKKGYLDALEKYNIPFDERLIIHSTLTDEAAAKDTHTLLNLPEPPDAIFGIIDSVAVQAIQVIKDKGFKIPEDISVVGFTNSPVSFYIDPSLTTVSQPAYEIGKLSAQLMLDQINNPSNDNQKEIIVKTELIIRNSSKKKEVVMVK